MRTRRAIAVLSTFTFIAAGVTREYKQQGNKLLGSGAGQAFHGAAVAISADGNTILMGSPGDNRSMGAAWLYSRSGESWVEQAKLVGSGAVRDGLGNVAQGSSVALSADGATAVIGGPYDAETGAVWVFTRTGDSWSQQGEKLMPGDAAGRSRFGVSVALSADGNTLAVGGLADDGGPGSGAGATWIFVRSDGGWAQQTPKLVGTGADGGALQGSAVAISADGGTLLVGGLNDSWGRGAAWVFTRSDETWSQQGQKLIGAGVDGNYSSQGGSVSLSADGNTAMIGGPADNDHAGAVWVFTRSEGVWAQQGGKLVGVGAAGSASQGSAAALARDGNIVAVGGPGDNGPRATGAVWVYERTDGAWRQVGDKLVGSGSIGLTMQGRSLAMSNDGKTVIIGGMYDNDGVGAAWIFRAEEP